MFVTGLVGVAGVSATGSEASPGAGEGDGVGEGAGVAAGLLPEPHASREQQRGQCDSHRSRRYHDRQ